MDYHISKDLDRCHQDTYTSHEVDPSFDLLHTWTIVQTTLQAGQYLDGIRRVGYVSDGYLGDTDHL